MTCEKFERVTMRGADQPLRSLAAAFPEFAAALEEAVLQIEYLHEKFGETGSGNAVVARARAVLKRMKGEG